MSNESGAVAAETNTSSTGLLARWNRLPLFVRILLGMIVGAIAGKLLGPDASWLKIPSDIILRVLGALAPPLILVAIIQVLLRTELKKGVAWRLGELLILNTIVAIFIGMVVANVIRPGERTTLEAPKPKDAIVETDPQARATLELLKKHGFQPVVMKSDDRLKQVIDNVPKSLLGPLGDSGNVLGVIFIAMAFGIALRTVRDRHVTKVADLIDVFYEALVVVLTWVIAFVPLGVLGIVADIVGTQGFNPFRDLAAFVLAVLLGLLLQACYYLMRVRFGSWVRPWDLLVGCRDALVMAFSTGSSTATMPVTFSNLKEKVGLRHESASLGALVGTNFNNDGTALYEAMSAMFVSQMLVSQGIMPPLTILQQVLVFLTSIVASVGAAGIPEAGLVTMTLVFSAVGLPPQYIGLLLTVDWFLDRSRTAINVMGDMNVSCILDGAIREIKPAPTSAPAAVVNSVVEKSLEASPQ